jgi:hypothetical protein
MDIRYRESAVHDRQRNGQTGDFAKLAWIQVNLSRIVNSKVDIGTSTFERERANGFAFQGVADGEYVIWTGYTSRADELLISEPKRIIVKGADVTGIELFAKPLASVAGTVVLEPSTIAECKDKRRPLF